MSVVCEAHGTVREVESGLIRVIQGPKQATVPVDSAPVIGVVSAREMHMSLLPNQRVRRVLALHYEFDIPNRLSLI